MTKYKNSPITVHICEVQWKFPHSIRGVMLTNFTIDCTNNSRAITQLSPFSKAANFDRQIDGIQN